MKLLVGLAIVAALVWYGYSTYRKHQSLIITNALIEAFSRPRPAVRNPPQALIAPTPAPSRFQCDGRTHCSHMRSCEEATFFLRNCPGTEMDGDNDGVPCESQWCG